jgi:hypothetical protein
MAAVLRVVLLVSVSIPHLDSLSQSSNSTRTLSMDLSLLLLGQFAKPSWLL